MSTITAPGMPAVRRLALGRCVSTTGTFAAYVALSLSLWQQTHSALAQTLGMLLTWGMYGPSAALAGSLADRVDRRRLMVVAETGAAACATGLVLWHTPTGLMVLGAAQVWALAPYFPAYGAAVPNLVADESELNRASGWLGIGRNVGILVGPAIGGLLYAGAGAGWVFAVDAATFMAGAALTASIRVPFQTWDSHHRRLEGGIRTGIAVVRGSRVLRSLVGAWVAVLLTFEGANVVFAPFSQEMQASGFAYGLTLALWGGGMVAGAIGGTRLSPATEIRGLLGGLAVLALGALGWALAPTWGWVMGATVLCGTGNGLALVADGAIFARRTPDEARGRASAVYEGAGSLSSFAGYLLGGVALATVRPQSFFLLTAAGSLVAVLLVARLLRVERVPTELPAPVMSTT